MGKRVKIEVFADRNGKSAVFEGENGRVRSDTKNRPKSTIGSTKRVKMGGSQWLSTFIVFLKRVKKYDGIGKKGCFSVNEKSKKRPIGSVKWI